jgi:hypothetical protein
MPRVRDGNVFLRFQSTCCRGRRCADGCVHRVHIALTVTDAGRSGEPRALATGSGSRPQDSIRAAHGKLFRNARLPPRGVSPLLTSPCPAHCRDASGARRIFATSASCGGHFDRAAGRAG